ncbi:carbonic anhydrase family protein [Lutibacter sp.]|uniref:carbonic anhydrase family protein n=1 Tax=Lutibacter sp. TaxID=1925666 RepID=UPI0025BB61C4|nr:carbonic anhydrase family protein [Lutibacter sp.]MCF6181514.1 carbonic anhydrase [Lutibacter sp.]
MRTLTKELQATITPKDAHKILVEGNLRFIKNLKADRNHKEQVLATSDGQFPFAVILSCMDSRVPAELVFDQGIGDIFSVRVAGNIINEDVLGSMEYACKEIGSKILVVMGHTNCGAVTAACNHYEMGNITTLLSKIKPSVLEVSKGKEKLSISEIEKVSHLNVIHAIERIRDESPILAALEVKGSIEIVGAMYSVETGKVTFLNN